jgi:hypothetical protein
MKRKKLQKNNSGFVILFAVTISSIILAIALGLANIALKEIRFGTSAKEANEAFFAADTGAECALKNDQSTSNSFVQSGGSGVVSCLGGNIGLSGSFPTWTFVISGLGSDGQNCAKVTVNKDAISSPPNIITSIISKGYNLGDSACNFSSLNRIEREVELAY